MEVIADLVDKQSSSKLFADNSGADVIYRGMLVLPGHHKDLAVFCSTELTRRKQVQTWTHHPLSTP